MSETKQLLDKLYTELCAKRDDIRARSTPLREESARIKNEALEKSRAMDAEARKIEEGLFDIEMQIGAISKAFGAFVLEAEPKR